MTQAHIIFLGDSIFNNAAVAYDPICGHGVKYALESAFHASHVLLQTAGTSAARSCQDELIDKFETHCELRKTTYLAADKRFGKPFLEHSLGS